VTEQLLTRVEAARILGCSPRVLDAWAYRGEGPPYYRIGKRAMYRASELDAWIDAQRRGPDPTVSRPLRAVSGRGH
jgi:hypothetical protein